MFGSLSFLGAPPYEDRKVDRYEGDGFTIDTCSVVDAPKSFETGIRHPRYKGTDDWMIVEYYDTREEAQAGHDKWVKQMTDETLPPYIDDIAADEWNRAWGNFGRYELKSEA